MSIVPYTVNDLRDGYVDLVEQVKRRGKAVSPRGYKTWEVRDATFTVLDTRKLLPFGVGRGVNPAIGAAEAMLLAGGIGSPSLLTSVSGTFRMFLDGGQLHGAYGPRIGPQIPDVVRRLTSDRDSRQAIISIWDPAYDRVSARDLPCTLNFGFHIRNDELHMSATMRSNDVWLGLTYDAFMFGQLGWTIAKALDVNFASYTHHAYSLHLYERNVEATGKLHAYDDASDNGTFALGHFEPAGFGPDVFTPHTPLQRIEDSMNVARQIHDRNVAEEPTQSELWYISTLDSYERLTRVANFSS